MLLDNAVFLVRIHTNQTAIGPNVAPGQVNFANRNLKAELHIEIKAAKVQKIALAR